MFCPNCGKSIENDAVFCSACGAKVVRSSGSQTNGEGAVASPNVIFPTVQKRKWAAIVGTAIAVVAVLAIVLFGVRHKSNPLPFGIHWGDSFSAAASEISDFMPAANQKSTDSMKGISSMKLDVGIPNDSYEGWLFYDFGTLNSLEEISGLVIPADDSSLSDDDILSAFVQYYSELCKHEPERGKSVDYSWTIQDTIIEMKKVEFLTSSDIVIDITYKPSK